MRYGMYQFKEQDAYDFANHVGARTQKKGDGHKGLIFKTGCCVCNGRVVKNCRVPTLAVAVYTRCYA